MKTTLNRSNQRALDAVTAGMADPQDKASAAQLAAFQKGIANQQAIGDKAAEEALRMKMQQESIVRALREYRKP